MGVKKRLDSLPKGQAKQKAQVPVRPQAEFRIVPLLVEAWLEKVRVDHVPNALPGANMRASFAGARCDRQLAYKLAGTEESDPMDLASLWRVEQGTAVHLALQSVVGDLFPGSQVEVRTVLYDAMGCTVDFLIEHEGRRISLELKTVGGYAFKTMTFPWKGGPEGPKWEHVVQACCGGVAADADEVHLGYVSMENASHLFDRHIKEPFDRFGAEWSWTREEAEVIAEDELMRQDNIATALLGMEPGKVAPYLSDPEIPRGAKVIDPSKGIWAKFDGDDVVDSGETWRCSYCPFQRDCVQATIDQMQR